jgi:hypothetical protein
MSPTGDLLVTFIFLWGRCPLELAQRPSCVALVLHLARRSTPFWVTIAPLAPKQGVVRTALLGSCGVQAQALARTFAKALLQ